jgi:hypothetical protein
MKKPFLPHPGYVAHVIEIGEFSAQADTGKVGEVLEAELSTAFPGWISIVLDVAGRPWACAQCKVQLASARREVA